MRHFSISFLGILSVFVWSPSLRAQIITFGTEFGGSMRILRVTNPNLATGSVSLGIDVTGFSQAGGTILNAPVGTTITGTSLNASAWDNNTRRVYFRDNQGSGNLFYWTLGASQINYVASAATLMTGGGTLLGDSGTIYNGAFWYVQDGTDNIFRYDLTTGGVRRFNDISGGSNRAYDFGDIAVNSAGQLFIMAGMTSGQNMVLDRIDISGVNATTGTPTSFSNITTYNNNSDGVTEQIGFDFSGTTLFSVTSITGGTGFTERTWHTINTGTGARSATIWTSTQNFSDLTSGIAIPEPATWFGIIMVLILTVLMCRKLLRHSSTPADEKQHSNVNEPVFGEYSEFETKLLPAMTE